MMMYFIALVFVTIGSVQARTFNNPILGNQTYDHPGAIKVDGTYYVVTTTPKISEGIFPIHSSTDLENWKLEGYVFNGENTPTWAPNTTFDVAKIYKVGINFQVYYTASTNDKESVGVALSSHVVGPYTAFDRPISPVPSVSHNEPTIINDQGTLYILFSKGSSFYAQELESNGLSFLPNQFTTILRPSLSWEGGILRTSWYIRRGKYHYILYTGGRNCDTIAVGVARSSNALGPYTKLPNPIVVKNNDYYCLADVSVVRDWEDNGHLIFLSAYPTGGSRKSILMATLSWSDDDWPVVGNF